MMKLLITLMLLCAASGAAADPFPKGNAQNGKKLFDQYRCNQCHDTIMGGDGNKIFTRIKSKVRSASDLIDQIGVCSGNVGANFSAQDKQDLGAYLNRYYKLK
ncbi:MAG: cytochrome c [Nitrosomonadales bacterium]|nr:cytochrome c [Nitrosomonadales bacterium]